MKQKMIVKNCNRSIALLTLVCFLLSDFASAHAFSIPMSPSKKTNTVTRSMNNFVIPQEMGSVHKLVKGKKKGWVLHIQDAHANVDAQKNIAKLLKYLHQNYAVNLINLEGSDGRLMTELFAPFSDEVVNKNVGEFFLQAGRLTGPELLAMTDRLDIELFGVEDEGLYDQNRVAYLEALQVREASEEILSKLDNVMKTVTRFIFSNEARQFYRYRKAYQEGVKDLFSYVSYLLNFSKKLKIDIGQYSRIQSLAALMKIEDEFDIYDAKGEIDSFLYALQSSIEPLLLGRLIELNAALTAGRIKRVEYYKDLQEWVETEVLGMSGLNRKIGDSYRRIKPLLSWIIHYESIDTGVVAELQQLEDDLRRKIFRTPQTKEIDHLIRVLEVYRKFFGFKLTSQEVGFYYDHQLDFTAEHIQEVIRPLAQEFRFQDKLPQDVEILDRNLPVITNFYQLALMRDDLMAKRSLERMKERNESISVLITGGFHSAGVERYLEDKGLSYVTILPTINKIDHEKESRLYESAMRRSSLNAEGMLDHSRIKAPRILNDPRFQLHTGHLVPTEKHGIWDIDSRTTRKLMFHLLSRATLLRSTSVHDRLRNMMSVTNKTLSPKKRDVMARVIGYPLAYAFRKRSIPRKEGNVDIRKVFVHLGGYQYQIYALVPKGAFRSVEVRHYLGIGPTDDLQIVPMNDFTLWAAPNVSRTWIPETVLNDFDQVQQRSEVRASDGNNGLADAAYEKVLQTLMVVWTRRISAEVKSLQKRIQGAMTVNELYTSAPVGDLAGRTIVETRQLALLSELNGAFQGFESQHGVSHRQLAEHKNRLFMTLKVYFVHGNAEHGIVSLSQLLRKRIQELEVVAEQDTDVRDVEDGDGGVRTVTKPLDDSYSANFEASGLTVRADASAAEESHDVVEDEHVTGVVPQESVINVNTDAFHVPTDDGDVAPVDDADPATTTVVAPSEFAVNTEASNLPGVSAQPVGWPILRYALPFLLYASLGVAFTMSHIHEIALQHVAHSKQLAKPNETSLHLTHVEPKVPRDNRVAGPPVFEGRVSLGNISQDNPALVNLEGLEGTGPPRPKPEDVLREYQGLLAKHHETLHELVNSAEGTSVAHRQVEVVQDALADLMLEYDNGFLVLRNPLTEEEKIAAEFIKKHLQELEQSHDRYRVPEGRKAIVTEAKAAQAIVRVGEYGDKGIETRRFMSLLEDLQLVAKGEDPRAGIPESVALVGFQPIKPKPESERTVEDDDPSVEEGPVQIDRADYERALDVFDAWQIVFQYLGGKEVRSEDFARAFETLGMPEAEQETLTAMDRATLNQVLHRYGIPIFVYRDGVAFLDVSFDRGDDSRMDSFMRTALRKIEPTVHSRNPEMRVRRYHDEDRPEEEWPVEFYDETIMGRIRDGELISNAGKGGNPYSEDTPPMVAVYRHGEWKYDTTNEVDYTSVSKAILKLKDAYVDSYYAEEEEKNEERAVASYPEVERLLRRLANNWNDVQALAELKRIRPGAALGIEEAREVQRRFMAKEFGKSSRDKYMMVINKNRFFPSGFMLFVNPHDRKFKPGQFNRIILAEVWDVRNFPDRWKRFLGANQRSFLVSVAVDAKKSGGASGNAIEIKFGHNVEATSFLAAGGGVGFIMGDLNFILQDTFNYVEHNSQAQTFEAPIAFPEGFDLEAFKAFMKEHHPETRRLDHTRIEQEMRRIPPYRKIWPSKGARPMTPREMEDAAWGYMYQTALKTLRHENMHSLLFMVKHLGIKNSEDGPVLINAMTPGQYTKVMRTAERSRHRHPKGVYIFNDVEKFARANKHALAEKYGLTPDHFHSAKLITELPDEIGRQFLVDFWQQHLHEGSGLELIGPTPTPEYMGSVFTTLTYQDFIEGKGFDVMNAGLIEGTSDKLKFRSEIRTDEDAAPFESLDEFLHDFEDFVEAKVFPGETGVDESYLQFDIYGDLSLTQMWLVDDQMRFWHEGLGDFDEIRDMLLDKLYYYVVAVNHGDENHWASDGERPERAEVPEVEADARSPEPEVSDELPWVQHGYSGMPRLPTAWDLMPAWLKSRTFFWNLNLSLLLVIAIFYHIYAMIPGVPTFHAPETPITSTQPINEDDLDSIFHHLANLEGGVSSASIRDLFSETPFRVVERNTSSGTRRYLVFLNRPNPILANKLKRIVPYIPNRHGRGLIGKNFSDGDFARLRDYARDYFASQLEAYGYPQLLVEGEAATQAVFGREGGLIGWYVEAQVEEEGREKPIDAVELFHLLRTRTPQELAELAAVRNAEIAERELEYQRANYTARIGDKIPQIEVAHGNVLTSNHFNLVDDLKAFDRIVFYFPSTVNQEGPSTDEQVQNIVNFYQVAQAEQISSPDSKTAFVLSIEGIDRFADDAVEKLRQYRIGWEWPGRAPAKDNLFVINDQAVELRNGKTGPLVRADAFGLPAGTVMVAERDTTIAGPVAWNITDFPEFAQLDAEKAGEIVKAHQEGFPVFTSPESALNAYLSWADQLLSSGSTAAELTMNFMQSDQHPGWRVLPVQIGVREESRGLSMQVDPKYYPLFWRALKWNDGYSGQLVSDPVRLHELFSDLVPRSEGTGEFIEIGQQSPEVAEVRARMGRMRRLLQETGKALVSVNVHDSTVIRVKQFESAPFSDLQHMPGVWKEVQKRAGHVYFVDHEGTEHSLIETVSTNPVLILHNSTDLAINKNVILEQSATLGVLRQWYPELVVIQSVSGASEEVLNDLRRRVRAPILDGGNREIVGWVNDRQSEFEMRAPGWVLLYGDPSKPVAHNSVPLTGLEGQANQADLDKVVVPKGTTELLQSLSEISNTTTQAQEDSRSEVREQVKVSKAELEFRQRFYDAVRSKSNLEIQLLRRSEVRYAKQLESLEQALRTRLRYFARNKRVMQKLGLPRTALASDRGFFLLDYKPQYGTEIIRGLAKSKPRHIQLVVFVNPSHKIRLERELGAKVVSKLKLIDSTRIEKYLESDEMRQWTHLQLTGVLRRGKPHPYAQETLLGAMDMAPGRVVVVSDRRLATTNPVSVESIVAAMLWSQESIAAAA